jgi:hypothetical protein
MNRPPSKIVRWRFFTGLGRAIHLAWPVLSAILAVQIALGLVIGWLEGWSVGDAIYFTFVTGLTIGYGDIVCRDRRSGGRLRSASVSPGSSSRA